MARGVYVDSMLSYRPTYTIVTSRSLEFPLIPLDIMIRLYPERSKFSNRVEYAGGSECVTWRDGTSCRLVFQTPITNDHYKYSQD
eukprot:916681-Amorphochlora_amoeboformis.AAC.1